MADKLAASSANANPAAAAGPAPAPQRINLSAYEAFKPAPVLNPDTEASVFAAVAAAPQGGVAAGAASQETPAWSTQRVVAFTTFSPAARGDLAWPALTQSAVHFSRQVDRHKLAALIIVDNSLLASALQEHGASRVYTNGYADGQGSDLYEKGNPAGSVLTKYFLARRMLASGFVAMFMDWDVHLFRSPLELSMDGLDLAGLSDLSSYDNSETWLHILAAGVEAGAEHGKQTPLDVYRAGVRRVGMPDLLHRCPGYGSDGKLCVCQSTGFWIARPKPAVMDFLLAVMQGSRQDWEQWQWQLHLLDHIVGLRGVAQPMRYALLDFVEAINYPQFNASRLLIPDLSASVVVLHFGNVHGQAKLDTLREEGWFMGDAATGNVITMDA